MSRLPNPLCTLLLATVVCGAASAQATLTTVPGGSSAADITPDGSIVVGSGGGQAYYWRWRQDPGPTFIGGTSATGVSDDGSVITGNMPDPVTGKKIAGRWTASTGWVPLHPGLLGECGSISSAYDISGDGNNIVGLGWNGCSGAAFLWTAPGALGTQELQTLGSGGNRASAIARDGSEIGGFAQGTSRSPAAWKPDLTGTALDISIGGELHGFSDDGKTMLGEWLGPAGSKFEAFYWPGWETDPAKQNFVFLGTVHPGWSSAAVDMAEPPSGSSVPPIIVGYDSLLGGTDAWVWTPSGGLQQLQALLTALGVPGVPTLGACRAITPNGQTIVGQTTFGGAWIVDFPTPGQVTVYGCNNPPPAAGNPAGSMTVVSGTPVIAQTLTLGIDNPLGTQPAGSLPFVVLATQPASGFPCGTTLPGFGMGSGPGELLIDIIPPNPILPALAGPPWTGPGSPAPVALNFPANPSLVGKTVYGQGVLLDFSLVGVPVGLTDAAKMVIGG